MRVWYPDPCALNHSRTSGSIRSEIAALDGTGFSPRRTMPRTTCLTSASGCSAVTRARSLRRGVSVELFFTTRRFAERDDGDFMSSLGMNDRYGAPAQKAECHQTL